MGLSLMILSLFLFIVTVISEATAGFVQENQNIFYSHSEGFEPAPISYQSYVNYDKFPPSDHNSFDVHSPKPNRQSNNLFKAADYAEKAAYKDEVENAHRVALAKRHNNTDAAYAEAYNEALKAQRKAGPAYDDDGAKNSYLSHQVQNQFGFNPEQLARLTDGESKTNKFQNHHYEQEDVGKVEFDDNQDYDLRKSVEYEYILVPGYEFYSNGVVHRQSQNVADTSAIQFSPAKYGSSPAVNNYYA